MYRLIVLIVLVLFTVLINASYAEQNIMLQSDTPGERIGTADVQTFPRSDQERRGTIDVQGFPRSDQEKSQMKSSCGTSNADSDGNRAFLASYV